MSQSRHVTTWVGILGLLVALSLSVATPAIGQTGAGPDAAPGPAGPALEYDAAADLSIGAAKGVLFYCGNGGNCNEGLSQIKAFYATAGATPVDELTSFPANLSIYRLIFLVNPTVSYSPAQVTALKGFLGGLPWKRGRLVVVGDHPGFWPGTAITNALLTDLGVPIAFHGDSIDSGCERFTPNISRDRLTRGIVNPPGLEYALTQSLTLGAGAKKLAGTLTGDLPFVAVHPASRLIRGDVVVVGDSNMLTNLCTPGASDQALWKNLLSY